MHKASKYGLCAGFLLGSAMGFIAVFFYIEHVIKTPVSVGEYYAYDPNGVVHRLNPPLNEPHNADKMRQWLAAAIGETFSFSYRDYQRRLQESTKYFTKNGWISFATYLQGARLIENIEKKQLDVQAQFMSDPVITYEGITPRRGRYRWIFEVPIKVSYSHQSEVISQDKLHVRLIIDRVPILENDLGAAIEKITMRELDG